MCGGYGLHKRVPTIHLRAAKLLGTEPQETAVFEDAIHAIKAAKQAGFITYAVEDAASLHNRDEIK